MGIVKNKNTPKFDNWLLSGDVNIGWGNIPKFENKELIESLLKEQGYNCGYCGTLLKGTITKEHLVPRDILSDEISKLNYENLIATCPHAKPLHYSKDIYGSTEDFIKKIKEDYFITEEQLKKRNPNFSLAIEKRELPDKVQIKVLIKNDFHCDHPKIIYL